MITRWKVRNYKAIKNETVLDFKPLTIFAGANSSGKSTLIQSILLIAQTLSHKVGSRPVVLNGALTSLGQFDDLKTNGTDSDSIVIKLTCKPIVSQSDLQTRSGYISPRRYRFGLDNRREVAVELVFDVDTSSPNRDLLPIQARLFSSHSSSVYRDVDNVDVNANVLIRKSTQPVCEIEGIDSGRHISDKLRAYLAYDVVLDDGSLAEVKDELKTAKPIGCMLRYFLPDGVIYLIDSVVEDATAITLALQEGGRHAFLFQRRLGREVSLTRECVSVLRGLLEAVVDCDQLFNPKGAVDSLTDGTSDVLTFTEWYKRLIALPRIDRLKVQAALRESDDLYDKILAAVRGSVEDGSKTKDFVESEPPRLVMNSSTYLESFFKTSLKYLGPLRDDPKPLYPLKAAVDPYDVGLRGEHTAFILDSYKGRTVRYIPSESFKSSKISEGMVTRTLEAAVVDWLEYLGVASSVQSRDRGKLGHELKVMLSDSNDARDLTHVGVGVSQVLPILVTCLIADTDSTLIFEQPELHLHPKVQTLLGDFFLSMALSDKQCIIETHSEYMIDRLRFRIAAAPPVTELNDLTKIYFVEQSPDGSLFQEVIVNEYGAIPDWPEGFFDQSQQQAEEILRAAVKKRKTNQRNKSDKPTQRDS